MPYELLVLRIGFWYCIYIYVKIVKVGAKVAHCMEGNTCADYKAPHAGMEESKGYLTRYCHFCVLYSPGFVLLTIAVGGFQTFKFQGNRIDAIHKQPTLTFL